MTLERIQKVDVGSALNAQRFKGVPKDDSKMEIAIGKPAEVAHTEIGYQSMGLEINPQNDKEYPPNLPEEIRGLLDKFYSSASDTEEKIDENVTRQFCKIDYPNEQSQIGSIIEFYETGRKDNGLIKGDTIIREIFIYEGDKDKPILEVREYYKNDKGDGVKVTNYYQESANQEIWQNGEKISEKEL